MKKLYTSCSYCKSVCDTVLSDQEDGSIIPYCIACFTLNKLLYPEGCIMFLGYIMCPIDPDPFLQETSMKRIVCILEKEFE